MSESKSRRDWRRRRPGSAKLQEARYYCGWRAFVAGVGIDAHGYKIPGPEVGLGSGPRNAALVKIDEWQQGWLDAEAAQKSC